MEEISFGKGILDPLGRSFQIVRNGKLDDSYFYRLVASEDSLSSWLEVAASDAFVDSVNRGAIVGTELAFLEGLEPNAHVLKSPSVGNPVNASLISTVERAVLGKAWIDLNLRFLDEGFGLGDCHFENWRIESPHMPVWVDHGSIRKLSTFREGLPEFKRWFLRPAVLASKYPQMAPLLRGNSLDISIFSPRLSSRRLFLLDYWTFGLIILIGVSVGVRKRIRKILLTRAGAELEKILVAVRRKSIRTKRIHPELSAEIERLANSVPGNSEGRWGELGRCLEALDLRANSVVRTFDSISDSDLGAGCRFLEFSRLSEPLRVHWEALVGGVQHLPLNLDLIFVNMFDLREIRDFEISPHWLARRIVSTGARRIVFVFQQDDVTTYPDQYEDFLKVLPLLGSAKLTQVFSADKPSKLIGQLHDVAPINAYQ